MTTKQDCLDTNSHDEVLNKQFHPQATKLVNKHGRAFAASLKIQSQIIAQKYGADIVLRNHVDEAMNKLNSTEKAWTQEILVFIGSALFGAFVQGFITEISTGNTLLIAIYTILGFLGMFLVAWAIRDK